MKTQLNLLWVFASVMLSVSLIFPTTQPEYGFNNLAFGSGLDEWQTFSYPEGKFQIDLPAEPNVEVDADYKTITAQGDKQVYRVTFLTKEGRIDDKEDFFQHSFDMYGSIKGEVEKNQKEGLEGRYATVKQGLSTFLIQVWQTDSRIWTLVCAKQTGKIDEALAKKFFDSFKASVSGTVANSTNLSSSTSTNTKGKNTASGDLKSYLEDLVIPDVEYLSNAQNWYTANLTEFVKIDAPKLLTSIKSNASQIEQMGYTGKRALDFAQNINKIKPAAAKVIENYLQKVKNTDASSYYVEGKTRIAYLAEVSELAQDFNELFAGDAAIQAAQGKAQQALKELLATAPYISSDFHLKNLDKIVLFSENVKVGSEAQAKTSQVIAPNQGRKVVAYFSKNLLNSSNTVFMGLTINGQYKQTQRLFYWKEGLKELFAKTGYAEFDFFPNPSELNFKSPYQFDPHINVLAYLLDQPEGQFEVELEFELDVQMKITETFVIDLSVANKQKIKTLHDALLQKRIDTMMMPQCTDNSGNISNKEGFAKYGKLLKYTQTDEVGVVRDVNKIGKPIIGKATGGWAAVELPDGSVELLKIGLSMPNGQTFWKFTALSTVPDEYEMVGATNYHPGKGKYGYSMKKENVAKCQPWE